MKLTRILAALLAIALMGMPLAMAEEAFEPLYTLTEN